GGLTRTTDDGDLDARLSAAFGRTLNLVSSAPAGVLFQFPAGTVGGAFAEATELPLGAAAPTGSFFDYGVVHVVASSTLDHLQTAYRKGRFDVQRFRPNIVVRTRGEPFVENSWRGRLLAIGDEVILRITLPCPRCVNTTLPQGDLPHDPGILRTIAEQ